MREYTKTVILNKFERTLKVRGKHEEYLRKYGLEVDDKILKAYFIGILRALTFDIIGILENRPAKWSEINGVIWETIQKYNIP
ncbi:MAG: hypothetical protein QXX09_03635 [Candidatus Methanomethylicia archaeon]